MNVSGYLKNSAPGLVLIGAAAALWVWQAPAELTLGNGIKIVYLHVAATWTGMTGLLVSGVLGAGILVRGWPAATRLAHIIGWTGLAFFSVGLAISAAAAWINWGGVALSEPRMAASLQLIALGLIVQILAGWPLALRLKGFLWAALALAMVASVVFTPVELHPRNPIGTSSSSSIQLAFFGLYILFLLAGVQLVRLFHSTSMPFTPDPG